MSKVLVTGGSGFIGSHTVDLLIELGYEVAVIDYKKEQPFRNDRATYHLVDILDGQAVTRIFQDFQPQAVIHLAAQVDVGQSLLYPARDIDVNLKGTMHILEECRVHGCKIIFASSAAVYGVPNQLPIKETHDTVPLSIYGLSKLCAEQYIQLYHKLYEIPYCILRYANVYGPRQDSNGEGGVVSIFVDQLVNGQVPTIYGDGSQTRDFVYVKDVARSNVTAIHSTINTILNVGNSSETSINDLFYTLSSLLDKDITPKYQDAKIGDIHRSMLDSTEIRNVLKWNKEIELTRGLQETINFFQAKNLLQTNKRGERS